MDLATTPMYKVEYKSRWYDREFVKVDSKRRFHKCGLKKKAPITELLVETGKASAAPKNPCSV